MASISWVEPPASGDPRIGFAEAVSSASLLGRRLGIGRGTMPTPRRVGLALICEQKVRLRTPRMIGCRASCSGPNLAAVFTC